MVSRSASPEVAAVRNNKLRDLSHAKEGRSITHSYDSRCSLSSHSLCPAAVASSAAPQFCPSHHSCCGAYSLSAA